MNLPEIAARCAETPQITVFDPRGLRVRDVQFNRKEAGERLDPRVTSYGYGARGEQLTCSDARFSAGGEQVNSDIAYDLQQRPIRERNVDSGEKLLLWERQGHPRKVWLGSPATQQQRYDYDKACRPVAFYQRQEQQDEQLLQRWQYGDEQSEAEQGNCRGQCTALYDTAGEHTFTAFDLQGRNQHNYRTFLADREQEVDWHRPPQLEQEVWHTRNQYSAGEELRQQALYAVLGETQRCLYQLTSRYNRLEQLISRVLLTENGQQQTLLQHADYNAPGICIREVLGNGVVRIYGIEPQTQRLIRLGTQRPSALGQVSAVQDITYEYDPKGNVIDVYNQDQEDRYFANSRVIGHNQYRYDTCDQLVYNKGRETFGTEGNQLPHPWVPLINDTSLLLTYERWYQYDRGGNLQMFLHRNARGNRPQEFVTSSRSNRTVMLAPGQSVLPEEVDDFFDVRGNLMALNGGQTLSWDSQQRLSRVVSILRENGEADYEHYQYDGNGIRCSKITSRVADSKTLARRQETITYLPGLRLCRQSYEQRQQGSHYTLTIPLASHSVVSCVCQEGVALVTVMRYSCQDAQGAVSLALSEEGDIITQEEYYPYGGTALYTARSDAEAEQKYYRYSGKERDNLSGLYDYGFRYYAPWLCRWISPDPLGVAADGPNLYCMVRNNPVTLTDKLGLAGGYERLGNVGNHGFTQRLRALPGQISSLARSVGKALSGIGQGVRQAWSCLKTGLNRLNRYGRRQGEEDSTYFSFAEQEEYENIEMDYYLSQRSLISSPETAASSSAPLSFGTIRAYKQGYTRLQNIFDEGDPLFGWESSSDALSLNGDEDWNQFSPAEAFNPVTGVINLRQRDFSLDLGDLPELLEELGRPVENVLPVWDGQTRDGRRASATSLSNMGSGSNSDRQPLLTDTAVVPQTMSMQMFYTMIMLYWYNIIRNVG